MTGYGETGRERVRSTHRCKSCRVIMTAPVPVQLCETCRVGKLLQCRDCRTRYPGDDTGSDLCKSCRNQERLF